MLEISKRFGRRTITVQFLHQSGMQLLLKLESPWPEVKEKLKEINHLLTDDDLNYIHGEEDILLERLSKKLQRTPTEVKEWIESVSFNKGKAS